MSDPQKREVKNPTNDEKQFYQGVIKTPFKERFHSNMKEFKHFKYKNSNELSIIPNKDPNLLKEKSRVCCHQS